MIMMKASNDDDVSQSCLCAAGDVYLTEELDHNILLLPTLTDSGRPALTLASSHTVRTSLPVSGATLAPRSQIPPSSANGCGFSAP